MTLLKKMIPFDKRIETKCGENCKHYCFDMDGTYCSHPKATEESCFGRSVDYMSRERLCFHGNDYEQPTDELFEEKS